MPPKTSKSEVFVDLDKKKKAKKKASSSSEDLAPFGIALGPEIGLGTFSKVRYAIYRNKDIAVKIISKAERSSAFASKFLPREIEVLSKLKHENIIEVYKIYNFPQKVYILMELLEADLLRYVSKRGRLTEKESRLFFKQMVSALRYLHSLNIAHRDLKCENIMISEKRKIKLIDFGFCRSTVDSNGRRKLSETFCGSIAYAAPEVIKGEPYNPMLYDVWSLGCVLYDMTVGTIPFDDSSVYRMVKKQENKQFEFPSRFGLSRSLKNLVRHMLEPDVTKRFSIERVRCSDWIKEESNGISIEDTAISRTEVTTKRNGHLVSRGTQANISLDD